MKKEGWKIFGRIVTKSLEFVDETKPAVVVMLESSVKSDNVSKSNQIFEASDPDYDFTKNIIMLKNLNHISKIEMTELISLKSKWTLNKWLFSNKRISYDEYINTKSELSGLLKILSEKILSGVSIRKFE